jgi:hypothetical protein
VEGDLQRSMVGRSRCVDCLTKKNKNLGFGVWRWDLGMVLPLG